MPVLSVSIPARKESVLGICALKYGVEANAIDRIPGESTLYVDLIGRENKIMSVACEVGAFIIEQNDKMPRDMND